MENGTESRTLAKAETKDDKLRVCIVFFALGLLIYFRFFFCGRDKVVAHTRKLNVKRATFLFYFDGRLSKSGVVLQYFIQTGRETCNEGFAVLTYATSITRWRQLQHGTLQIRAAANPPWSVGEKMLDSSGDDDEEATDGDNQKQRN